MKKSVKVTRNAVLEADIIGQGVRSSVIWEAKLNYFHLFMWNMNEIQGIVLVIHLTPAN